jgi:hypothetical protein
MKPKPSSVTVEKSGAVPSLPYKPSQFEKEQLYHSPLQLKSRAKPGVVNIYLINFIRKII